MLQRVANMRTNPQHLVPLSLSTASSTASSVARASSLTAAIVAALVGSPATVQAATQGFGTYKGGSVHDVARDVAFDSNQQIVIAGDTLSNSGIASVGAWDTSVASQDGFVAQYIYSLGGGVGLQNWGTYFGGTGLDGFAAVVHDSTDQIIAGGFTTSTGIAFSDPTTGAVHQLALGGGTDGLLVKFNNSGTPLWATYFGGPDEDEITGVCVASDGSVYATGFTYSATGIALNATHHTTLSGTRDGFIAKFTSWGALSWATYYGGANGSTSALDCAVDASGNVIIVGDTSATPNGIYKLGGWDSTYSAGGDSFIAKLSSAGAWTWGGYYGGTGTEHTRGVAVDPSNNIYIAGETTSSNAGSAIAGGVGAFDTTLNGTSDGFFAKFASTGGRTWGSYYGGPNNDALYGVAVAGTNVYLVGHTNSTTDIATAGSLDTTFAGAYDAMLVVTATSGGTPGYGQYIGGSGDEYGWNVVARSTGQAAVAGATQSNSGIHTAGAPDTTWGGQQDGYLEHYTAMP